jgi:heptosyltransferase-2
MESIQALTARLAAFPPARVLVVQTAFLGDTVFTSALVAGLAKRFPGATIDLCVAPRGRDVARAMPDVSEVFVYDKRGRDRGGSGLIAMARRLRARGHTLALLPHRSLRTALLARTAGIPDRLGFRAPSTRLLCTASIPDPGGPFLAREAALLSLCGAVPGPMKLSPAADDREKAAQALRTLGFEGARLAGLALGSEWETKIWPLPQMAAVAQALCAQGLVPLLLGGPGDRAAAAEVTRLVGVCNGVRCADTTGNSVGEALGLLQRCAVVLGGDTGLVHAARALGVPTVPIFGPTDPRLHSFGPSDRPQWLHLDCAPCGPHGHRRCPLGHHRCMRELAPEPVVAAALALAGAARTGPAA